MLDFKCNNVMCKKNYLCERYTSEEKIKKVKNIKPIKIGNGQTFCIHYKKTVKHYENM
jgi:hypothetical protein